MKKFKKALLSILSLALVAILSIGGTLAYLKSEDSDVNVMTMGNVKIAQHEYERVQKADGTYEMVTSQKYGEGYKLQEFTQAKPLYPATGAIIDYGKRVYFDQLSTISTKASGGQAVLDGLENVQDKFVLVENTGKSDAYTRTIFAFELGSIAEDEWSNIIMTVIGDLYNWSWIGTARIDENNYFIAEATYIGSNTRHQGGVLPAREYTYNSLAQVYMKNEATNEDVEAIDGNGNGLYDILVLSQAVQTKGFADAQTALDTAFGETNATNAAIWFSNMKKEVDSVKGNFDIRQNMLINLSDTAIANYVHNHGKNVILNGNGHRLESGSPSDYALITEGGNTTISNVDVVSAGGGIGVGKGGKVTFNGNSIYVDTASTSGRYIFYAEGEGSEITIENGDFSWDPTDNQKRAYIYAGEGTTVYVKGGTFGKASTRSGYTAGILGTGKVIITGGTFGFNPTTWVADGYEAVKDGTNWIVQAK